MFRNFQKYEAIVPAIIELQAQLLLEKGVTLSAYPSVNVGIFVGTDDRTSGFLVIFQTIN